MEINLFDKLLRDLLKNNFFGMEEWNKSFKVDINAPPLL